MSGWSYNPKDAERPVLEKGEYEATIVSAEHKTSKKGAPMCEVILKVYSPDGSETQVWDYLLPGPGTWKIKSMAEALGQEALFADGTFDPANFIQRNLRVDIGIKPASGGYAESNQIRDYQPSTLVVKAALASTGSRKPPESPHKPMQPEEIPF